MTAPRLHLSSARVIDGTGAAAVDRATVIVEDGRILGVRDASEPVPEGAFEVDLQGRTLMPGLVDAHVHVTAFDMPQARKGQEPIAP